MNIPLDINELVYWKFVEILNLRFISTWNINVLLSSSDHFKSKKFTRKFTDRQKNTTNLTNKRKLAIIERNYILVYNISIHYEHNPLSHANLPTKRKNNTFAFPPTSLYTTILGPMHDNLKPLPVFNASIVSKPRCTFKPGPFQMKRSRSRSRSTTYCPLFVPEKSSLRPLNQFGHLKFNECVDSCSEAVVNSRLA